MAARLHGSPLLTEDADLVPAMDDENLRRLARALKELDARLAVEGVQGSLEVRLDEHSFSSSVMGSGPRTGRRTVCTRGVLPAP